MKSDHYHSLLIYKKDLQKYNKEKDIRCYTILCNTVLNNNSSVSTVEQINDLSCDIYFFMWYGK